MSEYMAACLYMWLLWPASHLMTTGDSFLWPRTWANMDGWTNKSMSNDMIEEEYFWNFDLNTSVVIKYFLGYFKKYILNHICVCSFSSYMFLLLTWPTPSLTAAPLKAALGQGVILPGVYLLVCVLCIEFPSIL